MCKEEIQRKLVLNRMSAIIDIGRKDNTQTKPNIIELEGTDN